MNTLGSPRHAHYAAVVLAAILGVLATIGAFLLVCSWQQKVAYIAFASKAQSELQAINDDLSGAGTLLYTLAAFIGSNDRPVSALEFRNFSAAVHRRVSGLRDTAWAPRVTFAERPAFERRAHAAGLSGYRIRQFNSRWKLIVATRRPAYYAVLYIEAGDKNRPLIGLDLTFETVRSRAARRALRTGQPAATPPTDVLTVTEPGGGMLAYMPVYRPARGSAARPLPPMGLVLGVFDVHALVEHAITQSGSRNGLNLYVFNPAARSDRRVLYRSLSAPAERPLSEAALRATPHWESTVSVIDQRIGAIVTPVTPITFIELSLFGILTLAVGFTMTAMIVAYLLVSLRRTAQLEALTASLNATTVTLHENNERITYISLHDALTGMPNRLLFRSRIDQAIARFRRGAPFSLLFLDLDRFKAINDTLGHSAGDRLLCAVAERITASLREVDTAARLGGDEFAIILEGVGDVSKISILADRLIDNISKPYALDAVPLVIGVSIGAAIAAQGVTAPDIIAEADLAMYEAKDVGRGTFRVFEERLRARVDEKRLLEEDLRRALERDELKVYYQPIVDLAHGRVASCEALVRWKDPDRGIIPPDRFIPVAEECGLIGRLGSWMLRTACADAATWPQDVKLAVNISPHQLKDAALLLEIRQCLHRSGLGSERLEIEVTEASVLLFGETSFALLTELRAMGVMVAFDDFGSGYSSLSSLLRFPFNKIKINRSFLENIETSATAATIVRTVVDLGKNLGLTTTGVGVETMGQLELLRSYGCAEAQGFLFSPARVNDEIPELVRELSARGATAFVPKDRNATGKR